MSHSGLCHSIPSCFVHDRVTKATMQVLLRTLISHGINRLHLVIQTPVLYDNVWMLTLTLLYIQLAVILTPSLPCFRSWCECRRWGWRLMFTSRSHEEELRTLNVNPLPTVYTTGCNINPLPAMFQELMWMQKMRMATRVPILLSWGGAQNSGYISLKNLLRWVKSPSHYNIFSSFYLGVICNFSESWKAICILFIKAPYFPGL